MACGSRFMSHLPQQDFLIILMKILFIVLLCFVVLVHPQTILEVPYTCPDKYDKYEKYGYTQCGDEIQCSQFFFLFDYQCIKCPYFSRNDGSEGQVFCGDCVDNPKTWQRLRTCSYDYLLPSKFVGTDSGTFMKTYRNQLTLYYVTSKSVTQICNGCLAFCPDKSDYCFEGPSLNGDNQSGVTNLVMCREKFYWDGNGCTACPANCKECTDGTTCLKCDDGSAYNPKTKKCVLCSKILKCKECYYTDDADNNQNNLSEFPMSYLETMKITLRCVACTSAQNPYIPAFDQLSCVTCGQSCLRCEYVSYLSTIEYMRYPTYNKYYYNNMNPKNYFKRCRQCESGTSLSWGGQDCYKIEISNCLISYYSWVDATTGVNVTITTIDLGDFTPVVTSPFDKKTEYCARCDNGFRLSVDSLKCLAQDIDNTTLPNCLRVKGPPESMKCVECDGFFFDVAKETCGDEQCEAKISRCTRCYNHDAKLQCYQCETGYYVNVITNMCQPCDTTGDCATCSQYTQVTNITQDLLLNKPMVNWTYIQTLQESFPIEENPQCMQCTSGTYKELESQCSACDKTCSDKGCSMSSTCEECRIAGLRSLNAAGDGCISCPNLCLGCRERTEEEIKAINPMFNSLDNKQFTNLCFLAVNPDTSGNSTVFYDTELGMPVKCDNSTKCYKKVKLELKLYCKSDDYEQDGFSTSALDLQDSYAQGKPVTEIFFDYIESVVNYQRWNQEAVKSVDIVYQFIMPRDGTKCQLSSSTVFSTKLQKNIFSLRYLTFTLQSAGAAAADLEMSNDLAFSGISYLNITRLNIHTSSNIPLLFSFIENSVTTLQLSDVTIAPASDKAVAPLIFDLINVNSFFVDKLKISGYTYTNASPFNFTLKGIRRLEVQVLSLAIQNCSFNKVDIFSANLVTMEWQAFTFQTITITETSFFASSFISELSELPLLSTNMVYITKMDLTKVDIFQYLPHHYYRSKFINLNSVSNLILNDIQYSASELYESRFLVTNNLNPVGLTFTSLTLKNSYLIISFPSQYQNQTDIIISAIEFKDITCYNKNCLCQLEVDWDKAVNLQLEKIKMTNLQQSSLMFEVLNSVNSAYFTIKQFKEVYMDQVTITNGYGLPVLNVQNIESLQVLNSKCAVDDTDNQLIVDLDCGIVKKLGKVSNICIYVAKFMRGILFQKLTITGLISTDYPAILLNSYDGLEVNTTLREKYPNTTKFYSRYKNEFISFEDCVFSSNSQALFSQNSPTALIAIYSLQGQTIEFQGGSFTSNHAHFIVNSTAFESAVCIYISSPSSQVSLKQVTFSKNRMTNGQYSNVLVKVTDLIVDECVFKEANIYEDEWVTRVQTDGTSSINGLIKGQFYVNAVGAHLNVVASTLTITGSEFSDALAMQAAGIHYQTQGEGLTTISNCTFRNLMSDISYPTSSSFGGALVIDPNDLGKLQLWMDSVTMQDCQARGEGGCIYIKPSTSTQSLKISNSIFKNCFSLMGALQFEYSVVDSYTILSDSKFSVDSGQLIKYFQQLGGIVGDYQDSWDQGMAYVAQTRGKMVISGCLFEGMQNMGVVDLRDMMDVTISESTFQDIEVFLQPVLSILNIDDYSNSSIVLNQVQFSNIYETTLLNPKTSGCGSITEENVEVEVKANGLNNEQMKCTRPGGPEPAVPTTRMLTTTPETTPTTTTTPATPTTATTTPNTTTTSSTTTTKTTAEQIEEYVACVMTSYKAMMHYVIDTSNIGVLRINIRESIKKSAQLQEISITRVVCPSCLNGLITVIGVQSKLGLKVVGLLCLDNQCGYYGCLSVTRIDKHEVQGNSVIEEAGISTLPKGDTTAAADESGSSDETGSLSDATVPEGDRLLEIDITSLNLGNNVQISESIFANNNAVYGAGIYMAYVSAVVRDCKFAKNNADIGSGIFILSGPQQPKVYLLGNSFIGNQAKVAAAFFITEGSINDQPEFGNTYIQNTAINYGANKVQYPRQLSISLDGGTTLLKTANTYTSLTKNDKNTQDEVVTSIYLPSGQAIGSYKYFDTSTGQQIKLNMTFRVVALDENGTPMRNIAKTEKCKIESGDEGKWGDESLSANDASFNGIDWSFDQMMVHFDPYTVDSSYLELRVNCSIIKVPIYDSKNQLIISSYRNDYILTMKVRTFPCQVGEYYDNINCQPCLGKMYGTVPKQTICSSMDNTTMEEVSGTGIKMRASYYRAFEWVDGQYIAYCYNLPSNCLGGWDTGDNTCATGHIGALCESCDIYGTRSGETYSHNGSFICGTCSDTRYNSVIITLISLWTMISIFLSVRSTSQMVQGAVRAMNMLKLGILVSDNEGKLGILIKIFTNYLQVINTISTFRLALPTFFSQVTDNVGNPVKAMSYSMDCFLTTITNIEILYFRMIWSLLMPFFYLVAFLVGYAILILLKKTKYSTSVVYTTFIYMFIYLQPTMIGGFMQLASLRTISDISWVQSDVAYQYYTVSHQTWTIFFVMPMLIIWALLLPGGFFLKVYLNRSKLNDIDVRFRWGYFFNEYLQQSYYWEFVKILQKELIIIVLTYYDQDIVVKGIIVFIIIYIYGIFSFFNVPYRSSVMNNMDRGNTLVCSISIVLGLLIYQTTILKYTALATTFWVVLGFVNFLFIAVLLWLVLEGYINKLAEKLDPIRDKINAKHPHLQTKYPRLRPYLINRTVLKARAKHLWAELRYQTRKRLIERRNDKTLPIIPNNWSPIKGETLSPNEASNKKLQQVYPQEEDSLIMLKGNDSRQELSEIPKMTAIKSPTNGFNIMRIVPISEGVNENPIENSSYALPRTSYAVSKPKHEYNSENPANNGFKAVSSKEEQSMKSV